MAEGAAKPLVIKASAASYLVGLAARSFPVVTAGLIPLARIAPVLVVEARLVRMVPGKMAARPARGTLDKAAVALAAEVPRMVRLASIRMADKGARLKTGPQAAQVGRCLVRLVSRAVMAAGAVARVDPRAHLPVMLAVAAVMGLNGRRPVPVVVVVALAMPILARRVMVALAGRLVAAVGEKDGIAWRLVKAGMEHKGSS